MPNHRFLLTLSVAGLLPFLVLAQEPQPTTTPTAAQTEAGHQQGMKVIDELYPKLKEITSLRADLRQEVDMLGQKFAIGGQFLKASDNRLRLELTVEDLPETQAKMLQICDGTTLWDYSNILGQEYYGKLEIKKVLERLANPEFEESLRVFYTRNYLGLTGPQALVEGLRDSVTWDTVSEGEIDGKPVHVLRGKWTEMTALGFPPNTPLMQIPAHIPTLVVLWLGKDDGFPYQVLMQGKKRPVIASERKIQYGPDGRPVGNITKAQEDPPSRYLLKYSNVQINPPVNDADFFFSVAPAMEASVRDNTADRLADLERAEQQIALEKQAAAAKGQGPGALLNQGIDLQTPGSTTAPLGPGGSTVPGIPAAPGSTPTPPVKPPQG